MPYRLVDYPYRLEYNVMDGCYATLQPEPRLIMTAVLREVNGQEQHYG